MSPDRLPKRRDRGVTLIARFVALPSRITLSRIDRADLWCIHRGMERFRNCRLARMSSGRYRLIRDLDLVEGGKGLRHHEVVLDLSWRGLFRFLRSIPRSDRPEEATPLPGGPTAPAVSERALETRYVIASGRAEARTATHPASPTWRSVRAPTPGRPATDDRSASSARRNPSGAAFRRCTAPRPQRPAGTSRASRSGQLPLSPRAEIHRQRELLPSKTQRNC